MHVIAALCMFWWCTVNNSNIKHIELDTYFSLLVILEILINYY
jgi:hypothetical protein